MLWIVAKVQFHHCLKYHIIRRNGLKTEKDAYLNYGTVGNNMDSEARQLTSICKLPISSYY